MYSNDQELHWSNVTLMTYKDSLFGSDGFLRLSLSTSTSNFKDFNQPKLNFMISNNFSKTCQLSIIHSEDIVKALDNALDSLKTNGGFKPTQVKRIIKRNVQLVFSIVVDENKHQPIVKAEIISNESDFTRTIMPLFPEFTTLVRTMRRFNEDYITICSNLLSQAAISQILNLPELIKGIPSGIVSQIPAQDVEQPVSEEVKKGSAETADVVASFDEFMNTNIDDIKVPELEKADDHHVTEINSKFTTDMIENDLSNLETIMNNASLSESPMTGFGMKLAELFDDGYKSLPGITDKETKSLQYMSKMYFSLAHQNYVNNGMPLPHATPIFKYKAKEITDDNIELAYDLLTYSLYIRGVRRRLEGKETDALKNCSLFHVQLRCFVDPFIFSFIDKISVDKLSAVVLQRYKYYKDLLVFASYERRLKDYNCAELTENDISSMVTELAEKVIGKTPFICDLHDKSMEPNSLRLASENNFNLEQIINEVVPLEVAEKMGKDLKDNGVIEQIKKTNTITDEVLNFFKKSQKKVKVKKESVVSKGSNLERAVKYFKDDIPEQHQESFINFIHELGSQKFNFVSSFPLDEFGDDVIKALYVWDIDSDPQVGKNYKHLLKRIETEIMEKDQILASVREEAVAVDDGWGDIV